MAYGGHFYFVSPVCDVTIGSHVHVSQPTYRRSLLTQYTYSSARTLLISRVIALTTNYQHFKLGYWRKIHSTLRHSSAILQNIRLRVETREWNKLMTASEQFTTAKSGCANASSNSRAHKVCGWIGWSTLRFVNSNLAKLYTRIENAHKVRKKKIIFL